MTARLITTPDGEIVYDPPHTHHIVWRNGQEAWCCSTRGTHKGRVGPLTRIRAGSGEALIKAEGKRLAAMRAAHSRAMKTPQGGRDTPAQAPSPPPTNETNGDYPPTLSTATAEQSGAEIVRARTVTTKYGARAILVSADGTEYWGSPFITKQVADGKAPFPGVVASYRSAKYDAIGYKLIPAAGGQ